MADDADAMYRRGEESFDNPNAAHARAAQVFTGLVLRTYINQVTGWGDLDGGDVQEWLLKAGLFVQVEMAEPCGDACACLEFGADFPTTCCRPTGAARAAIEAAKANRGGRAG